MRVQNEKVIKAWLGGHVATSPVRDIPNGVFIERGASISTDGEKLYSYWTPIAWREDGGVVVDMRKYSLTTTMQQSDLKQILAKENIEYKAIA